MQIWLGIGNQLSLLIDATWRRSRDVKTTPLYTAVGRGASSATRLAINPVLDDHRSASLGDQWRCNSVISVHSGVTDTHKPRWIDHRKMNSTVGRYVLTLWSPTSQFVTLCRTGLTYHFNLWYSGTLALSPERQSVRMSEIKNGSLGLYGAEHSNMTKLAFKGLNRYAYMYVYFSLQHLSRL